MISSNESKILLVWSGLRAPEFRPLLTAIQTSCVALSFSIYVHRYFVGWRLDARTIEEVANKTDYVCQQRSEISIEDIKQIVVRSAQFNTCATNRNQTMCPMKLQFENIRFFLLPAVDVYAKFSDQMKMKCTPVSCLILVFWIRIGYELVTAAKPCCL